MNVREVIAALNEFDQEAFVYVPDLTDGTAQIAAQVMALEHVHCPEGIAIPDDVTILPARMCDGDETT